MKPLLALRLLAAAVFVAGSGYIVYANRPVVTMEREAALSDGNGVTAAPAPAPTQPETTPSGPKFYVLDDVAKHGTTASCWTAINGGVYDVTDFVNRHPGGSELILGLCGRDGSADFNGMHGGSARAASTLVLYKIGLLK